MLTQVDHSDHLHHISQLQLYEYQLDNGVLGWGGGTVAQQPLRRQMGLLAQEVKEVIPDAVKGSVSSMRSVREVQATYDISIPFSW